MTSPNSAPSIPRNKSFRGNFSFLRLQDQQPPLSPKGHGALSSIIKSRGSTTSLLHWRGDDEEGAYGPHDGPGDMSGSGLLGGEGNGSVHGFHYDSEDGEGAGGGHGGSVREERRLSALLSTPQVRSMRLIGKANPRYRWERYWKTEEELKGMKRKEM